MQNDVWLIAAPTKAGENFMKQAKLLGLPYIAVTNNKLERLRFLELGVQQVIQVDTTEAGSSNLSDLPDYPVGKVIIFEESLPLCCRYIGLCRGWTSGPIYVITQSLNPRLVYKGLGADYVIYSKNGDVKFLLSAADE
ncbi:hypothetical protein [Paenibacillus marchantiophytorum]|nr:hypothetical protein [Paenibacillus marchantiophytorum]